MTRLDAIQEMLEGIGAGHASALDSTGSWPSQVFGTTNAADAERILDRETKKILAQGWFLNTLSDFVVKRPTYSWTYSGAITGTFTFGETITQAVSGATGVFNYSDVANKKVYVGDVTGTPNSSGNLTGGISGATVTTVTAATALTSSKIAGDPLWLSAIAGCLETRQISMTYDSTLATNLLVDMWPDNDANPTTQLFTVDQLRLDAIKNLDFVTLPQNLAQWCVAQAQVAFQRYKKNAGQDDAGLAQRAVIARAHWMAENTDNARTNVLRTQETFEFKGGRRGVGYGHW